MTSVACLCKVWGARAFRLSKSCLHGELQHREEKLPWRVFSTYRQLWKKVPGVNGREKKRMKQQHMAQVGIAPGFLQHFCGTGHRHLWWALTSPRRDMLKRTCLEIHTDWPGSVCCFSQHPCSLFPPQYFSIFSSPVGCVPIWLFLWKQTLALEAKNNILSSWVQPSMTELEFNWREAFNSFSPRGDGVKHKIQTLLQFAAVKIWSNFTEINGVSLYLLLGKKRWNLGLCTSGELNLSQEANKCALLFHRGGFTRCFSQRCSEFR